MQVCLPSSAFLIFLLVLGDFLKDLEMAATDDDDNNNVVSNAVFGLKGPRMSPRGG